MKKNVLIIPFLFFAINVFCNDHLGNENRMPEDNIPREVLVRFYSSFIVSDDGVFRGAMVGEIREYLSIDDILTLISNQGVTVYKDKIIDRHRPRPKRCKYNSNWLCQFDDEDL